MNEFNQNPMTSAKGLASLGRGNDSMLVHMTPREVAGLQSLAMAHGGSLSVNPQTGLPEAGFLDSILPTLVGVTTGLFTANPWLGAAAGTAAGGVGRKMRGEEVFDPLRMGLDALGGYGGSSLATGLSAAGSGAAAGTKAATAVGQTPFAPLADAGARNAAQAAAAQAGAATPAIVNPIQAAQAAQAATAPATLGNIGQGIGEIFKSGFGSYGPGTFGTTGGKALALDTAMAAAPLLPGMFETPKMDVDLSKGSQDDMKLPDLEFNVGTPSYASEEELRRGIEHDYFGPERGYQLRAAEGGLMSLAKGGEVSRYQTGGAPAMGSMFNRNFGFFPKSTPTPSVTPPKAAPISPTRNLPVTPFARRSGVTTNAGAFSRAPAMMPSLASIFKGAVPSQPTAAQLAEKKFDRIPSMSLAPGPAGGWNFTGLPVTRVTPAPAPAPAPSTPTTPSWLGSPAQGMPSGFYNIKPDLFPFYQFREDQDYPGYGIYTPGAPTLSSWSGSSGDNIYGIRNADNIVSQFGQNTSFGQELLRRGSMGLNYRFPYDTNTYGIQQYGYVPPDVTEEAYNQRMRELANQYAGTPNAFVAYYNPELTPSFASGGLASFAAGGRPGVTQPGGYLDGAGDGMSDSIPATIANKQPARLADGEFVVSADVVSGLGNGSSKAGAKQLYAMMDRVRQARTGTKQQGRQINPNKFMPA